MPAAIAIPLISSAIAGGAAVGGAALASHGANKAAKTQAGAATDALNFEKQQYAAEQERLKPYRELGGQAYAKLGRMFGLESGPQGAPTAGGGGSFSFANAAPSMLSAGRSMMGGGTVRIRHPRTGEVREVPVAQAELLKQRGGQVVA